MDGGTSREPPTATPADSLARMRKNARDHPAVPLLSRRAALATEIARNHQGVLLELAEYVSESLDALGTGPAHPGRWPGSDGPDSEKSWRLYLEGVGYGNPFCIRQIHVKLRSRLQAECPHYAAFDKAKNRWLSVRHKLIGLHQRADETQAVIAAAGGGDVNPQTLKMMDGLASNAKKTERLCVELAAEAMRCALRMPASSALARTVERYGNMMSAGVVRELLELDAECDSKLNSTQGDGHHFEAQIKGNPSDWLPGLLKNEHERTAMDVGHLAVRNNLWYAEGAVVDPKVKLGQVGRQEGDLFVVDTTTNEVLYCIEVKMHKGDIVKADKQLRRAYEFIVNKRGVLVVDGKREVAFGVDSLRHLHDTSRWCIAYKRPKEGLCIPYPSGVKNWVHSMLFASEDEPADFTHRLINKRVTAHLEEKGFRTLEAALGAWTIIEL